MSSIYIVDDHKDIVQDISAIVAATAALITAFTAIAGVIYARMGFRVWKAQLKGKTDYELARRYLRTVYRVRDAIKFLRNPFIPAEEIAAALKEAGLDSDSKGVLDKEMNRTVYAQRWKKVFEAESDLKLELFEAEVSWGNEAREVEKEFHDCIYEIYSVVKLFLSENEWPESPRAERRKIYDLGEADDFNMKLNSAISKIEKYLRPHLT